MNFPEIVNLCIYDDDLKNMEMIVEESTQGYEKYGFSVLSLETSMCFIDTDLV